VSRFFKQDDEEEGEYKSSSANVGDTINVKIEGRRKLKKRKRRRRK
jgi:hypothetical protein